MNIFKSLNSIVIQSLVGLVRRQRNDEDLLRFEIKRLHSNIDTIIEYAERHHQFAISDRHFRTVCYVRDNLTRYFDRQTRDTLAATAIVDLMLTLKRQREQEVTCEPAA